MIKVDALESQALLARHEYEKFITEKVFDLAGFRVGDEVKVLVSRSGEVDSQLTKGKIVRVFADMAFGRKLPMVTVSYNEGRNYTTVDLIGLAQNNSL